MNDLQLVRELDDSVWPTPQELQAARASLLTAIAADRQTPSVSRRRVRSMRPSSQLGLVGSLVAAALVAFLVITLTRDDPAPVRSAQPATTDHSTAAVTVVAPAVFLQKAAATAAAEPDAVPRPDQFYYIQDGTYQAWLSMDGTHDGKVISGGNTIPVPGCRDGQALVSGNYAGVRPQPCTPQPAYLADAPTTAPAMAAYLTSKAGSSSPNNVGKELLSIAEFNYLRPAARAALYEAVPLLPGLALGSATITNAGVPAVAITWTFSGFQITVLFNPRTYAYLGTVTNSNIDATNSTNVRQAIVDAVGKTT